LVTSLNDLNHNSLARIDESWALCTNRLCATDSPRMSHPYDYLYSRREALTIETRLIMLRH